MSVKLESLGESADLLYSVYGQGLHRPERLLYPRNEDVDDLVVGAFRSLREKRKAVCLVDGAFDVPHPAHEHYLRHCKALGAAALLGTGDPDKVQGALNRDDIALVVTVDADEKIALKKSGKRAKGGVERPIYPWSARADRVAGYAYELGGVVRYVANLVTVEGDEIHKGTLLESSLTLARGMKDEGLLDYLVVYGEHGATVEEARDMGLDPIVISDSVFYGNNPQTGEPWSSSSIIARAQGAQVVNSVTRPGAGDYE